MQAVQAPELKAKLTGHVAQLDPLFEQVSQFVALQIRQAEVPPSEKVFPMQAVQLPLINPKVAGQVAHKFPL